MPAYATQEEFQHLATRVDILEREVDGEKTVTRYILEQTRRNGDDLAAVKTRLDRVEQKVDGLERKVDGLTSDFRGLVTTLPTMIGEAVREAFRERDGR